MRPVLRFVPVLALLLVFRASPAAAHPAPFSYLDLRLAPPGVTGTLTVHDLDAAFELRLSDADALLDPTVARRHEAALAAVLTARLHLLLDGRRVAVTLSDITPVPDRQGLRFTVSAATSGPPGRVQVETTLFPYDPNHQTFVNVYEGETLRHQAILDARHPALDYLSLIHI